MPPTPRPPSDVGSDMITSSLAALFVLASVVALTQTSVGAAPPVPPAADPEPPPRLAGEVVKVEVTRYTDRDGSKSRSHEAKVKEIVRKLLAHFPEAAT